MHKKENDEDTANRHAAQIYAEMLGQVCHPEFYDTMNNEYQEVSHPFMSISTFIDVRSVDLVYHPYFPSLSLTILSLSF